MALVLTRRLQPLRGLVDIVPIITVVLLLLFFFLLSSAFVLQPGIKVDPPRSDLGVGTSSSRFIVAVTLGPAEVDASGAPLKREPVLYFNDEIVTLDGFRTALDRLPPSRMPPSLILKADKEVPLDVVTGIINIAGNHHFPVYIATQPGPGASP